ncbi:MAG: ATP-binding protein [Planctomycetota bacterium]|jgi:CO dehydrogenase maturation factor
MKIAITGKGGVGKTTVAALLAHHIAAKGREVIAVDADPDANLASALGIAAGDIPEPISEMKALIEERTGAKGGYGAFFKINPRVDDLPEKYCHRMGRIRLLVLGGVRAGGSGCICPASAVLKALVMHLVLGRDETVILDMEAGIEHLGRATAQGVSAMIVVVEPGARSIQTARTIQRLAAEIRVENVTAVVNKHRPGLSLDPVTSALGGVPVIATLPWDEEVAKADIENRCPYTGAGWQAEAMEKITAALEELAAKP